MDPSAAAIASRRIVFPPVGLVLVLMISAIIGPPIRPYPDGLGGLFARCSLWVRSGHAATARSVSIGMVIDRVHSYIGFWDIGWVLPIIPA
jgi:hypothetical protein